MAVSVRSVSVRLVDVGECISRVVNVDGDTPHLPIPLADRASSTLQEPGQRRKAVRTQQCTKIVLLSRIAHVGDRQTRGEQRGCEAGGESARDARDVARADQCVACEDVGRRTVQASQRSLVSRQPVLDDTAEAGVAFLVAIA